MSIKDANEISERIVGDIYILTIAHRRRCTNCKLFDETKELCNKYAQRPPARVIAEGCEGFSDINDIPF